MNVASQHRRSHHLAYSALHGAVTAAVCAILVVPQSYALSPAEPSNVPSGRAQAALTSDQKVEHAVNRLTFGPRPGDEAAVKKMGLEAWFQQQLHPETVDDSAFERQMAMFPTTQLTQEQLVERFPSPKDIKKESYIRRGGSGQVGFDRFMTNFQTKGPADPVARVILADSVYAYDMDPKRKAGEDKAAAAGTGESMTVATGTKAEQKTDRHSPDPGAGGMPPAEVQGVLSLPPEERMQRLLSMSPQQMYAFRTSLKGAQKYQLLQGLTPSQTEIVGAMQSPLKVVGAEALESRLLRDVDSERQLQAVMTDFWLNHFNVYGKKNQNEPYFLSAYLRDSILPNSLGNFEKLLVATAESPAMLMYLDNWESIGPDSQAAAKGDKLEKALDPDSPLAKAVKQRPRGINENYARELMELHTLGVRCEVTAKHQKSVLEPSCGSGYTQADVTNVAKVLTGWTIDKGYAGGKGMVFDPKRHEPGDKAVLGATIRQGGSDEGLQVLHMLATSPATAHFISYKLAVRFVSDTPPDALVNRMADAFTKTHGDIKAVLTAMFHSPEFWSPEVYRAKIKTPIEFVSSAVRASGVQVNNTLPLVLAMDKLGMPIYGMQTPNGYSWTHDDWVSSNALIARMNFALVLSGDLLPGARPNWPALLGDSGNRELAANPTPETERRLEQLLLGQPATERTRASVLSESKDPALQRSAVQSFAIVRGTESDADDADGAMKIRASKLLHKPSKGGREPDLLQPTTPGAPLDTMAGLLLGSPDFQRR